jgi:hypothetical protein
MNKKIGHTLCFFTFPLLMLISYRSILIFSCGPLNRMLPTSLYIVIGLVLAMFTTKPVIGAILSLFSLFATTRHGSEPVIQNNLGRPMKLNHLILVFLIAGLTLAMQAKIASADTNQDKDGVPFDVGKANATATIEIHVSYFRKKMTGSNPDTIALMIIPPSPNQKDKELTQKYTDLFRSLTGKNYFYHGDEPLSPHKGITVRVTWRKKTGTILRQTDVYSDDGTSRIRITAGASFTLDEMSLPPGDYSVTVESLHDDSRFDGVFRTVICSGYIFN